MPIIGGFVMPHPPIVVSEVGKGEETHAKKTIKAMEEVAEWVASLAPDTIIVSTPHMPAYSDYFQIASGTRGSGNLASFGAPQVELDMPYNEALIHEVEKALKRQGISGGTKGAIDASFDHGTMVPLYFINKLYKDYNMIRLALSGESLIEHYRFGKTVQDVLKESSQRVLWLASGDLSHKLKSDGPYGFVKEGPVFDARVVECLKDADFLALLNLDHQLVEEAAECGLRSFIMMAGALDQTQLESSFLSYEGPYGVGYAVAKYEVKGMTQERDYEKRFYDLNRTDTEKESELVKLARDTIAHYFKYESYPSVDKTLLNQYSYQAATFVSLKKFGQLRGCMGTLEATQSNLIEEVMHNAVSAAFHDPRFENLEPDELEFVKLSVDVLASEEPIQTLENHDVKRYGLIVEHKQKKGVLLPDIEGIHTAEMQRDVVLKKAGISSKETYQMYRFEVMRYI